MSPGIPHKWMMCWVSAWHCFHLFTRFAFKALFPFLYIYVRAERGRKCGVKCNLEGERAPERDSCGAFPGGFSYLCMCVNISKMEFSWISYVCIVCVVTPGAQERVCTLSLWENEIILQYCSNKERANLYIHWVASFNVSSASCGIAVERVGGGSVGGMRWWRQHECGGKKKLMKLSFHFQWLYWRWTVSLDCDHFDSLGFKLED